jgi:acetyl esterase/lipase
MNTVDASKNPQVERRIREFLAVLNSGGGAPLETLSPAAARKVLVDAQASVPLDLPACDIEEKSVVQDGLRVSLTIVRPAGSTSTLPGFLFIHGGGWILGDFPTHERFVRDIVADSGFTAIFVNYTPSPEAKYPTALNEIHAAAKWLAAHGAEIRVDASRLAIFGNSVDVLRDEGLAYARHLDAAGVDTTVVRYENLIHDYGLLNAISQVPAVRDALHQASETLRKHLG